MTESTRVVLDGSSIPAEDDLRLPRPPGVIRRFWARHPRLADVLLVVLALLLSIPTFALGSIEPGAERIAIGWLIVGLVLAVGTSVSLMWRRRYPLTVFIITFSPIAVLDPLLSSSAAGVAPVIALYSVAVYRSSRAAMWTLAAAVGCAALTAFIWTRTGVTALNEGTVLVGSTTTLLLIGALIGVNVGGRKRYVEALIERSRQLAVERDQQAQLAAAAERTRIAREMHDIVSHSLAVVVALAEGAHATDDPHRSKQASRAIADTAREALTQMRVMLGVLRTDAEPEPGASALPLGPLLDLTPQDVVETARAAGLPVTLTVAGTPAGSDTRRLTVLRVVQEGLTNAMRYAHDPGRIAVTLDYTDGRVRVSVENDGVRADEPSRGAGFGIRGLQERVSALGGTLQAGPVGASSWRLVADLPEEDADG